MSEFNAGAITAALKLNVRDWQQNIVQAQRDSVMMTGNLKGMAAQCLATGAKLAGFASVAVLAYKAVQSLGHQLRQGVRDSIAYESAFAGVRKTVNATAFELDKLRDKLRGMTLKIPVSFEGLAEIASLGGQLGIRPENIAGFTDVIARMTVATDLTAEAGSTALAQWANVTGMAQEQFSNLASTIVALGNTLATTESRIVEMGQRIAAAGSMAGLADAEIAGFAAALSSVGIDAEAGGTAFTRVIETMSQAVAKGGRDLDLFAAMAGQSAAQFSEAFQNNTSEAIIRVIEGLDAFKVSGGNAYDVLEALGLQDIRTSQAMLRAANASDLFRDAVERGNREFEANNALNKESAERFGTTESQAQLLKNAWRDLRVELADNFNPVIQASIGLLASMVEKMKAAVEIGPRVQASVQDRRRMQLYASEIGMWGGGTSAPGANIEVTDDLLKMLSPEAYITRLAAGLPINRTADNPIVKKFEEEAAAATQVALEAATASTKHAGGISAVGGAARQAAQELERLVESGERLHRTLNPLIDFTYKLQEDLKGLGAAGLDDSATLGLLGQSFWDDIKDKPREFQDSLIESFAVISPTVAENIILARDYADALERIKRSADIKETEREMMRRDGLGPDVESPVNGKAEAWAAQANDVAQFASILGQLPGKYRAIGQAAQAASRIMSLAANIASKNWIAVAQDALMLVLDALGLMGDKAEEELKGMGALVDELKSKGEEWARSLSDEIAQLVRTGKADFQDLFDSIMEEMISMATFHLVLNPVMDFLGGAFAKGAAFQGGNIIPFARGGVVKQPTLFPMASGAGLMGEAGPEAVMPLKRLSGGRLGVSAEGGAVVNIIDQRSGSDPAIEVKRSRRNGRDEIDVIVTSAVRRALAEGRFDADMALNFGLPRRGK